MRQSTQTLFREAFMEMELDELSLMEMFISEARAVKLAQPPAGVADKDILYQILDGLPRN